MLCWSAFPLVPALRSPDSAACFSSAGRAAGGPSALFAGFIATMASPDVPRPCIIGFGSSPSRCGPPASSADGQTRDLPSSDTILSRVMCSSTPAEWAVPRIAALLMLRSAAKDSLRIRDKGISELNHTPHVTAVYASCSALLPPHATLATRRLARPYLDRTCTGRSRQLSWRLPFARPSVTGLSQSIPFLRYPVAGVVLLYGVGARPPPDGVRRG